MNFSVEFENESGLSKYPFSDSCSLVDSGGNKLPEGLFLDISVCLRGSGAPRLSRLTGGTGTFSINNTDVAFFSYTGPGSFAIMDASTLQEIGVVVLGKSAGGAEEYEFNVGSAELCPSCFCLFPSDQPIFSISDGVGQKLRGAVRICGSDGVYVTKINEGDKTKLRIDIIGAVPVSESCCSDPVRNVILVAEGCPIVAGAGMAYTPVTPRGKYELIPGVVLLRSSISADSVCGNQERYIDANGKVGLRWCDTHYDDYVEPECIEMDPVAIFPSNGNIDFVPYSAVDSATPLEVETIKAGSMAFSAVMDLIDPDMKNLAILSNSGTVVLKFKRKN